MTKPQKMRPVLLDRPTLNRRSFDCRGVSPVIAVILMVAITVVLAAVLYVMVSVLIDLPPPTPKGSLSHDEDDIIPGKYLVNFQGSVSLNKIEITVYDISSDEVIILDPTTETSKGAPSGMNLTFEDLNENNKIDGSDIIIINGGALGDKITVLYKPTGEAVATHTLT